MIDKNKDKILGSINSKDSPEEVFTEGFCDLIVYNGIVKFNVFSRPIHSKELINTKKINKTLTFTSDNFEKSPLRRKRPIIVKRNNPVILTDDENLL